MTPNHFCLDFLKNLSFSWKESKMKTNIIIDILPSINQSINQSINPISRKIAGFFKM